MRCPKNITNIFVDTDAGRRNGLTSAFYPTRVYGRKINRYHCETTSFTPSLQPESKNTSSFLPGEIPSVCDPLCLSSLPVSPLSVRVYRPRDDGIFDRNQNGKRKKPHIYVPASSVPAAMMYYNNYHVLNSPPNGSRVLVNILSSSAL